MKKRSRGRKRTAIFLAAALVFGIIPQTGLEKPALAALPSDPVPASVVLAEGGKASNILGAQKSSIWFGNYPQSDSGKKDAKGQKIYNIEPVKWRVLDNHYEGDDDSRLYLISDQSLDCRPMFPIQYVNVYWRHTRLRSWLNGYDASQNAAVEADPEREIPADPAVDYTHDNFKDEAFSKAEFSTIVETPIMPYNPKYALPNVADQITTMDKLFAIPLKDVRNVAYGFDSNASRKALLTDYALSKRNVSREWHWWTNAPGYYGSWAVDVEGSGSINEEGQDMCYYFGVRPAMNMDSSYIAFSSMAEGGKDCGEVRDDALTEVKPNAGGEWKLTLWDDGSDHSIGDGHGAFQVESVSAPEEYCSILKVDYSGAATGDNEYISALTTDAAGNVTFYGRVKRSDSPEGSALIDVSGRVDNGGKLFVFNEQYNGDKKTDYTSRLIEVEERPKGHKLKKTPKTEPDCTHTGIETYWTCSQCPTLFSDQHGVHKIPEPIVIPALGHDWGEWTVTKPAELGKTGERLRICRRDAGHRQKETIPALTREDVLKADPTGEKRDVQEISSANPVKAKDVEKTILKLKEKDVEGSGFSLLQAKGMPKGATSIKLTWKKVPVAEKYIIYGNKCGPKNKFKKIAVVKGTSYVAKKLKKGTYHKFIVVAVFGEDAVAISKTVHVTTKGGKKGNHTKVKLNKAKLTLAAGKSSKVKATLMEKKTAKVNIHRKVGWESDDIRVAAVSKGKITAVGKGTCYVYAYAQNGVAAKVKVTVE